MSSIVYLRNLKSNTIYAYLNESVWDPEKKKCVNKRKCIGHVDPETGEIVPNRKARSRHCPVIKGNYICEVFDRVASGINLSETLALAFPDHWKMIMTAAYYLAVTEKELQFCKQWTEQNKTPYNQVITPNMLNELLGSITSNSISLFFTLWRIRVQPEESYVSSISFKESDYNIGDYSRNVNIDLSDLSSRIKMDIYFSTKNNIPICYYLSNMATGRRLGDYDVSPSSFSRLSSFLDEENGDAVDPSLIAYAKSNLIVRTLPDNEFVRTLIEKAEPSMTDPKNYRTLFGIPLFIETYMHHVNGKKFYVHIFFDPNKAVGDLSTFISIVNLCKYELEMNRPLEAHIPLYEKYLIVKEENGRTIVEHNSEAILHHNEYLGYSAIISNFTRNPSTAMVPFLQRKTIIGMFDSIVNDYDNASLNLFSETNHLSRIFIQFIALILRLEAENIMNAKKLNKVMTYKEMVNELSSIRTVKMPGLKKPLQTEISDAQMRILNAFDIDFDLD
jgi:hypothetical protein